MKGTHSPEKSNHSHFSPPPSPSPSFLSFLHRPTFPKEACMVPKPLSPLQTGLSFLFLLSYTFPYTHVLKPKTKVSEQEGEIRRVWVPRTHLVHHEKQWVGDGESPRLYRVNQPWLALKKLDGGLFEIFELFLNSFTRNKQEQQMPTRIKEVL